MKLFAALVFAALAITACDRFVDLSLPPDARPVDGTAGSSDAVGDAVIQPDAGLGSDAGLPPDA